jgi:PAS domain-containing protein
MTFDKASVLFFLLASVALLASDLLRRRVSPPGLNDHSVKLAALAALLHPLAWWIADIFALKGDLTPFLAFDLIAACAIAAAVANQTSAVKSYIHVAVLSVLAASALAIGVQQVPGHGTGVTAPLMAAVLLCTIYIGTAAECGRHARLAQIAQRPVSMLALLSGIAAMLQLLVVLIAVTSETNEDYGPPLLSATGIAWLVLKLMLISTLLKLLSARSAASEDRISRQLVAKANAATNDLLVVTQAFYQLPGNVLVTDDGGRILFATAQARRLLAYPETKDCVLEDLFLAVQPSGHQLVRALFEKPDHQAELMQIRMTRVECGEQGYHLLQLETLPFDYAMLRGLLVDSRNDAAHEATGLLDHHFSIAAMADGWFRLMDPIDRYAASGVFWDKLRILSNSDSEIAYLENSIASANEAQGWLRIRHGGSLSVSLKKLQTPDYKLFYRLQMTLVDDALQTSAHAPCADNRESEP